MFIVTNISNNPLPLTDGKGLAPGDRRKLETVEKLEKNYESRGWLSIYEEKEESKPAEHAPVKPAASEVRK